MTACALLIGHGSRDEAGVVQCHALMDAIGARLRACGLESERCFLELVDPDIAEGVGRCLEREATEIVLVPLLLFAAGHWKRDIPSQVQDALEPYHGIVTLHSPALGVQPRMVALCLQRFRETLSNAQALLLVGRGSRDADAAQDFARLADHVQAGMDIGVRVATAVMTGIGHSIEEALDDVVVRVGVDATVVIVPYLLFPGLVQQELAERAHRWAEQHKVQTPVISSCLWPSDYVVDAFVDNVMATVEKQDFPAQ